MADDELENDGSGKKPLLRYLLLGAAALIVVAVTVLATMFFVSADRSQLIRGHRSRRLYNSSSSMRRRLERGLRS